MKKIKFALLLGDKPCRSLEDIRENFNADDIIKNFDKGVLTKWLKTYNLDELYNKAISIDKDSGTKLNDLLDLFFDDTAKKEELLNNYKEEQEKRIQEEKRIEAEKQRQLEEERKKNYEILINSLIENKTNYDFIKDTISENHKILMENYSDFFEKLKSGKCLFGILSVLANENTRDYFLNDKNIMDSIKNNVINSSIVYDMKIFGKRLEDIGMHNYMFNKIKIYRLSHPYYRTISDKMCLILHIEDGITIKMYKHKSNIYNFKDINGKFPILDGIDCQNDNNYSKLVYMEID
ncbi:hypothetical protein [Brachyspira pulli]|uniref:hypothetical protein n=1 Tax=Brachyspira pulli TaxID=310721 RepID=UPI0030044525